MVKTIALSPTVLSESRKAITEMVLVDLHDRNNLTLNKG